MTTQPSNESELQLYRVLQRANLLAYYDTFICQGGDDVQQLCEAGEEEFLEIMALVGMASKPLHVRRLQKALQEWITNPALFQSPGTAPFNAQTQSPISPICSSNLTPASSTRTNQQVSTPIDQNCPTNCGMLQSSFTGNVSTPSPNQFQNPTNGSEYSQPYSPISMTPVLVERQIHKLAEAAETLVKSLPSIDLKPLVNGNKKRICKDIENIMLMSENDPKRMDEIRKYAAIYGRFDCKRKPEKPLTLHEVSVNEAAAQICSKIPALLYRRDELFPLARQVVRDSGYQYSKGHSRSQSCSKLFEEHSNEQPSSKRIRLESSPTSFPETKVVNGDDRKRRHDRLEGIVDQIKSLGSKEEEIKSQIQEANERQNFQEVTQLQNELEMITDHHMQLVSEKTELEKQATKVEKSCEIKSKSDIVDKVDTDDTDSQFSMYSNESTPSILQESHQNSSSSEITMCMATKNIESIPKIPKEKKKPTASTNTTLSNSSNDSTDFASKQIINEALDEGLRVVKELGQVLDENIDLRLFNKYSEVLRSSGCFGTIPESLNTKSFKPELTKAKGKTSKTVDRDLTSTFYEQIMSQAQIQQQMQLYQTHLHHSLQAQAVLFGDYSLPSANTNQNNAYCNENSEANKGTNQDNFSADFGSNELVKQLTNNNNQDEFSANREKDEMTQSLNALNSLNNNILPNDQTMSIKHELSIPSVEFKIA